MIPTVREAGLRDEAGCSRSPGKTTDMGWGPIGAQEHGTARLGRRFFLPGPRRAAQAFSRGGSRWRTRNGGTARWR